MLTTPPVAAVERRAWAAVPAAGTLMLPDLGSTESVTVKPPGAVQGLPTREQLSARWPGVRATAGKLGMLTQGQGGLLSLTLARIASGLKVPPQHATSCWNPEFSECRVLGQSPG